MSYLASTTTDRDDPEWVVNVLSMSVLGQELMTPEMLADPVDLLQKLREDPNMQHDPNMKVFFQLINGIDSIGIEPDQMIIRARDPTSTKELMITDTKIEDDEVSADDEVSVSTSEESTGENESGESEPTYFLRH